ncbi:MAG: amidohydrolase family protein [Boseongicola sp.]|nr:amidohydrolase family protein [Boseongicola sp.]
MTDARKENSDEPILFSDLEIVDPHHHLVEADHEWGRYLLADLQADTTSGHHVVQTVYAECHEKYRDDGPEHLRPVGETEWVAKVARESIVGPGAEIAGIIAHADLTLDARLEEVLDAHEAAADGRFCGIRHCIAHGDHRRGYENAPGPAPKGLAEDERFREGVRLLGRRGIPYDSWHHHYQMDEFIALAQSAPDTTLVMDHFGTPVAVGQYLDQRKEIYENLNSSIAAVAECPNVVAKLGGMAMPDNGFPWANSGVQATAEEFAAAQRDYYLNAIDCFGPDRCMFESNFPVDRLSISYRSLFNAFKLMTADFSDTDKQALFSGTARKIYALPPVRA